MDEYWQTYYEVCHFQQVEDIENIVGSILVKTYEYTLLQLFSNISWYLSIYLSIYLYLDI